MSRSRSCVAVVAVAVLLASAPLFAQPADIDRVVTFGASLSDAGNAFVWLSQPENRPCGIPINVPPYDALEDLVPSGPYAKGGHHFTNGETWVERLARGLALAGNTRPALRNPGHKASNYAVGGARAIANYPCRFNLPAQVAAYLGDFPQTSPLTLVAIEIGGNDVRDALVAALSGQDPAPYIQAAVGSLAYNITQLHAHGARRFLVLNAPDVGKTPAVRLLDQAYPGVAAFAGTLSQAYNSALALATYGPQGLTALSGIDLRILDVYTILNDVVASPEAYGFLNATDACVTPNRPPFACTKPDTYAFWDGIHPTAALHAVVAEQALAVLSAR